SGIEMALWDIVGKIASQPVYNLLGGQVQPRIRVYANGWATGNDPPDVAARQACRMVDRGFTALKWDPFPDPRRAFPSTDDERAAIESVSVVREAVGPH